MDGISAGHMQKGLCWVRLRVTNRLNELVAAASREHVESVTVWCHSKACPVLMPFASTSVRVEFW
jgi:hypothetical protein